MKDQHCVIIGASHAGVNCAFSLRKEGWEGTITLFDGDEHLPYHRPPLSKSFLTSEEAIEKYQLKALAAYEKDSIHLQLGTRITQIDRENKTITTDKGNLLPYNKLIIATGARALIPSIKGLDKHQNIFPLRSAYDVVNIKKTIDEQKAKSAIIIGGGYIGLEIAASLRKLAIDVTLLEREGRLLARVTAPEVSKYFQNIHETAGVKIQTSTEAIEVSQDKSSLKVSCNEGQFFLADFIIVGVGIRVNTELAADCGLAINNGIVVNEQCQTNDDNIFAIGDCTYHYNPHYDRNIRLESVQNAVDQAKVVAKSICQKEAIYDSLPWFWSDQYDLKLQMVGLPEGYSEVVERVDPENENKRSAWFFKNEELLAVQAVNDAKAYVFGTKLIKQRTVIDKHKVANSSIELKSLLS